MTLTRWPRFWVLAITLAAFLLRTIDLNNRPLWYDEAFAVLFAEKGFSAMLAGTLTPVQGAAADVHPVIYYTALSGWMQAAGESPLAVRALSAFTGLLTVAVLYQIAGRLFGERTGRGAMVIAGVSPFLVYYAQEARMYAPLALFCSLTVLCLVNATRETPQSKLTVWLNWIGVTVFAAAAMYMQNLAAVFLLTLGLSTLFRPKVFLKMAAAGIGAFVLWLPWFLNVPSQLAKLQQAYWVSAPTPLSFLQTAMVYHGGEEMLEAQVALPLVLFAALVLPLMLGFRLFRTRAELVTARAAWVTLLAAGTPLVLFAASFVTPVYIQRALLPAAAMYALSLAWLLTPRKFSQPQAVMPAPVQYGLAGLLGLTMALGLWAHYSFEKFPRPNFPEVLNFIHENSQQGDVVLHSNKLTFLPMVYYDRVQPQAFLPDPPGSGSDTLALPTQNVLGLHPAADIETAAAGANRIWFVIFNKAITEFAPNPHPQLEWLKDNFLLARTKQFGDLAVYEFRTLNP